MDVMLDGMLSRCRGVVSFISEEWGILGSKKSDADFVKAENENGQSAFYRALVNNKNHQPRVVEYWRTAEACKENVPRLKRQVRELKKVVAIDHTLTTMLSTQLDFILQVTPPLLRKSHTNESLDMCLLKCEALAEHVVLNHGVGDWIREDCKGIRDLLNRFVVVGAIASSDAALQVLDSLADADKIVGAKETIRVLVNTAHENLEIAPTLLDIDPKCFMRDPCFNQVEPKSIGHEDPVGATALAFLDSIQTKFQSDTVPTVTPTLTTPNVLKMNVLMSLMMSLSEILAGDSPASRTATIDAFSGISDHIGAILDYLQLGTDVPTRCRDDPFLAHVTKFNAARQGLKTLLDKSDTPPGILKALPQ